MSDTDKHTNHNDSEHVDPLIDSLLQQLNKTKGKDDEDFLDRVESSIDEMEQTSKVIPLRKGFQWKRPMSWAAGIAAMITVGLGLTFSMIQLQTEQAPPPQYVIQAASSENRDELHEKEQVKPRQIVVTAMPEPRNDLSKIRGMRILDLSSASNTSIAIPEDNDLAMTNSPTVNSGVGISMSASEDGNFSGIKMQKSTRSNPSLGKSQSIRVRGQIAAKPVALSKSRARSVQFFGVPPANIAESITPRYGALTDNVWNSPEDQPLSTFSIDVDTASWTNVRGMIRTGHSADQIPDDAVRIEEMINYFDWNYPQPKGDHPFAFAVESAVCPWNPDNQLLRVGIQGKDAPKINRPAANLVFLLDVSGSMNQPNKLPLVKRAISILVEELNENDRVTMVVYAGAEGVALAPTPGSEQLEILSTLKNLHAGGSTNGGAGIKLAYKIAAKQFIKGGINRVILCTDGDFNVGVTANQSLVKLVESKANDGVFLSVCGFGRDNLNDSMLEEITNKGNGNYFFIDSAREAQKVFLKDLMGTLLTIAKDVKIQIEFNPAQVASYRLIGYANRQLKAEDFENDKIDAGEVGSGHSVTALYEIVPAGKNKKTRKLRYQVTKETSSPPEYKLPTSDELALLKLRYKKPQGNVSIPMEQTIMPSGKPWDTASEDYRFAASVALFGMILREHDDSAGLDLQQVLQLAEKGIGNDPYGYRTEFVDLVKSLSKNK